MKIRTDFVTNSSSTGYVAIRIDMHDGKEIAITRDYDTGYGGYFWSSSDASRAILKHDMTSVRNGRELLELLARGIDDFEQRILGTDPAGACFRTEVLDIADFGKVKAVYIAEETRFDGGERREATLSFENGAAMAAPGDSGTVTVPHVRLSMAEAQADWTVKTGKAGITLGKYSGNAAELTVPAYVDGQPVIALNGPPAKDLPLKVLNIPDTVRQIGSNAFQQLKKLTEVNIAGKDTAVSSGAFYGCSGLEDKNGCIIVAGVLHQIRTFGHVVISPGITRIPHRIAYEGSPTMRKYQMTSLVIPEGVEVIEAEAFSGQNALERVVFPSTLKEIGDKAFWECHSLGQLTLPEGLRRIGDQAFSTSYSTLSLLSIDFPSTLEWIGDGAFALCRRLYAAAPNHVPHIGARAFMECFNMADPKGMTIVKNTLYAYKGDASKVEIPEGVECIGERCFLRHSEIRQISLPSTLKRIGTDLDLGVTYAFSGCTGLADENGFVIVGECLWQYVPKDGAFPDVIEVPEGVKAIHQRALSFPRDGIVRTVILPASVTHAAPESFDLVKVIFKGTVPQMYAPEPNGLPIHRSMFRNVPQECYEDGFYISGDTLLACNRTEQVLHIPEGIKRLASCSLYPWEGSSLILPESVETVELPQFGYGTGIKEISVPAGTRFLGEDIPKLVVKGWAGSPAEEFVKKTAKHCSFLKTGAVAPDWTVKKLKDGTIQLVSYNVHDREHVVIPDQIDGRPVTVLGKALFSRHGEIRRVDMPDTVTVIEANCFYYTKLEEVRLSRSLKKIGMMAFRYCGLEKLDVPASVEELCGGSLDDVKTVIIRGDPKLKKNLTIFHYDARIYADPDTEVCRYVGRNHCRPLSEL